MTECKVFWEDRISADRGISWGWGMNDYFLKDWNTSDSGKALQTVNKDKCVKEDEKKEMVQNLLELCKHPTTSRYIQDSVIFLDEDMGYTRNVFKIITKNALDLSLNNYGNFIIQKFLAPPLGAEEKFGVNFKEILVKKLVPQFWSLTASSHGCRILQKCLEASVDNKRLKELMKEAFVDEAGDLTELIDDKSGNHVIQKLLDVFTHQDFQFLIDYLCADPLELKKICEKKFGCRVVQKTMQKADMVQKSQLIKKLIPFVVPLARDEYGNYVISEMIKAGSPSDRRSVIAQFENNLTSMAQNRYASHVLEAAFTYGDDDQKSYMITAILTATRHIGTVPIIEGQTAIAVLMKDSYGNYVVQKMLLHAPAQERKRLLRAVHDAVPIIYQYRWGKQMLQRIQKAIGFTLIPDERHAHENHRPLFRPIHA